MLKLVDISDDNKPVLQRLATAAQQSQNGTGHIRSDAMGYPVWHFDCDRADLARIFSLSSDDFAAHKALEQQIEALTHARLRSYEYDEPLDCGPALRVFKRYQDPACTRLLGFHFEMPCLIQALTW
ncbi:MAG: hypothetical protein ISP92_10470 [Pseudomonadales bacterium]|nr:hypothetical protein [Pseudomonadales bacterium]MDA0761876.1 hypothetical protein [Pseudomonadota bacterium]